MAVHECETKPELLAHFPDGPYRWLELRDQADAYGYAAIAERGDDLELHLTLARWGPGVRRSVGGDVEWLKAEARRLGMRRILGVRIDSRGRFDPQLFRFAELFGFSERCVLQTIAMPVD